MHMISFPASTWRGERQASIGFAQHVAASHVHQPVSILADAATIVAQPPFEQNPLLLVEVPFRTWIKSDLIEDGVLDIEQVRHACSAFPANSIVVLDATGFKPEIIVHALAQARIGLYALERWPAVFMLISDDTQLFQVAQPLSSAFYLQPSIFSPSMMQRAVKRIASDASSLRLFGRSMGSIANFVRRWRTRRTEAHEQKLKRERGWLWDD
ncbi:hypothetical protein QS306_03910 [Paraburkholderia bonniea]|uniref:hypothetical protein n=1 Tax=Paraburkholderia bonniea TaxID=2152891 RepID=UPI00129120AC|nr:hypothetical protein [Paraburkholderia bonniea]WJF90821.1 hypothetical protein QS306_03910 [Paraburkholderia bonniea]WJF94135.1 hypothetical protein QS308_03910 [Paraburkholderia bonniea]